MVDRIQELRPNSFPCIENRGRVAPSGPDSFEQVLRSGLKLSRHVSERIGRRELDLGGDKMQLIENAVDKAAAKGARESLVLLDNLALVVSVKNRTVITAMDKSNLKEGVFTQIDSAVII
jgi:flagellar operon protein